MVVYIVTEEQWIGNGYSSYIHGVYPTEELAQRKRDKLQEKYPKLEFDIQDHELETGEEECLDAKI